jgi:spore coat protein CotH
MKQILLLLTFFFCLNAQSQTGDLVFNDTVLHNLVIETDLVNWFDTLEQDFDQSMSNPDLYPERYHKCKVTWDSITLGECGFREKGNASNLFVQFGKKKPFKIAFDKYIEEQELDGLGKINLNNFTNDPSLLHDALSFKLMRDAGILAPRTSYTKLWINNEYIGLYIVIENVDKTFLKFAFGSSQNDGNLYKTDRGASVFLEWLGAESTGYKASGLKLTTNESTDNWTGFINFVDLINNNNNSDFKQLFETGFDVHTYLKVLAIEKCVKSWDSYWGGGNNFYLYEHPDGKMRWIPWDMNETFQDIKLLEGTSLLNGYLVPTPQFDERPLLKRIFEIEEYKTEYLNNVCDLLQTKFSAEYLGKYCVDMHNLIDAAYKSDVYKYNTYEAFQGSLTERNEDVVSLTHSAYVLRIDYPGIFPFIQTQREWASEQMNAWKFDCSLEDNTIYNLSVYPNPSSGLVNVKNELNTFEYAQFRLYDYTGKLVLVTGYQMLEGEYHTLSLKEIPAGIYLLTKQSADGRLGRAKVVVK